MNLGTTLSIPALLGSHLATMAGFTGKCAEVGRGHLPPSLAVLLGHGSGLHQGLASDRCRSGHLPVLRRGNHRRLGFLLELVQSLQKRPVRV